MFALFWQIKIQIDFNSIILCICGLVISLTIEIVWLYYYRKNWWHSVYIDAGVLLKFRRYTFYIGIIAAIVKLILIVVLGISLFIIKKKENKPYKTPVYEKR